MTTDIPKKKGISDLLQQLINDANETIRHSQVTIKEKLLYVYNQAIEEGYPPKEARKMMYEKITVVSDRWIREVLPDEAKNLNMRRLPNSGVPPQISQETETNVVNIPQTPPNIIDVEAEPNLIKDTEEILKDWQEPQQERRTPEAPDNSMVEQLHIINVQLKKEIDRLRDENIRLKQDIITISNEKYELEKELGRHRRLEELRLEAQRKAIKQWNQPGHKPT